MYALAEEPEVDAHVGSGCRPIESEPLPFCPVEDGLSKFPSGVRRPERLDIDAFSAVADALVADVSKSSSVDAIHGRADDVLEKGEVNESVMVV